MCEATVIGSFFCRSCQDSLGISINAKLSHLQTAWLWFFCAVSQGAGFPHMCSMLQAALVLNQDLGLSQGAWPVWDLKTGKHICQSPKGGFSCSAHWTFSSHLPLERKEGSLGLPERWGSKLNHSPGSQTETVPGILGMPFPTLGKSVPGAWKKKIKMQAQIIEIILIIWDLLPLLTGP